MVEHEHYRQMANRCSPVSGQPRSRIHISLDITEFSLFWWQCQLTLIFSIQWDIKGQHPSRETDKIPHNHHSQIP
jgi:hypothetical protein